MIYTKSSFYKLSSPLIIIIGLLLFTISCQEKKHKTYHHGPVDNCRKNPEFIKKYGLTPPVFIDLRQKTNKGITIMEAKQNGKILRRPSWSSAGTLGAYTMDNKGNIFISPMPHVSLYASPLELENLLYKVDTQTGVMDSFLRVPVTKTPNSSNPYGITGMTYDCETQSLYTASIAGSSRTKEIGIITQIELDNKKVLSTLKGIDAIGITIFNTRHKKRLYFGLARQPEIFSVEINEEGTFVGQPQFEFSLINAKGGGDDRAHKLTISNQNIMTIKAIEFNYTLMAASDPNRNIYQYQYDNETDKWRFKEVRKQHE